MIEEINDLHTKLRPTDFDGILGQEHVIKSLKNVLKKKTSRAFIFEGPAGTGKTTLARIVATKVGSTKKNIVEVDAATNTGIDAMREVTEHIAYSAIGGGSKTYIIDEAHMLSKQAWASLLKKVEEPPRGVHWCFCTTDSHRIPDQIRQRTQQFQLEPVDDDTIFEFLVEVANQEGITSVEKVLHLIAMKCGGSPRLALTMLAQCDGCKSTEEAKSLIRNALDANDGDIGEFCRALNQGLDWQRAMRLLKQLEGQNPESIRMVVLNWFTKAALDAKTEKIASKYCAILDAFATPYPPTSGMYPVVLSLGSLLL